MNDRSLAPKLYRLAVDVEQFEKGAGPTEADLASAPLIGEWAVAPVLTHVLVGSVSGHPKLPPGPVRTSQLYLICRKGGWARTLSRFYRLGSPADDTALH